MTSSAEELNPNQLYLKDRVREIRRQFKVQWPSGEFSKLMNDLFYDKFLMGMAHCSFLSKSDIDEMCDKFVAPFTKQFAVEINEGKYVESIQLLYELGFSMIGAVMYNCKNDACSVLMPSQFGKLISHIRSEMIEDQKHNILQQGKKARLARETKSTTDRIMETNLSIDKVIKTLIVEKNLSSPNEIIEILRTDFPDITDSLDEIELGAMAQEILQSF